jgi:hypothetical protein
LVSGAPGTNWSKGYSALIRLTPGCMFAILKQKKDQCLMTHLYAMKVKDILACGTIIKRSLTSDVLSNSGPRNSKTRATT